MSSFPLSSRWTRGERAFGLVLILIIVGVIVSMFVVVFTAKHYSGEYFEQDATNPSLYYVYIHEVDNPDNRYKIEVTSKLYAKHIAECVDTRMNMKSEGYVVYNGEPLPYEVITNENKGADSE